MVSDFRKKKSGHQEQQHAAHRVAQQAEQLSPANRSALERILNTIEPGDSYATLARKSGLFPTQVKRLFDAIRLVAIKGPHQALPA